MAKELLKKNNWPIRHIKDLIKISMQWGDVALYRGEPGLWCELRPKLARHEPVKGKLTTLESSCAKEWCKKYDDKIQLEFEVSMRPHLKTELARDDDERISEMLMIAQRYGLPTRLLDWSTNILVAAYFAVSAPEPKKGDGGRRIYALLINEAPYTWLESDFKNDVEITQVSPPHIDARILAQSSVFTCHPFPFEDLRTITKTRLDCPRNFERFAEWIIPEDATCGLRKELDILSINAATIMPDLQGVAEHIKWMFTEDFEDSMLDDD